MPKTPTEYIYENWIAIVSAIAALLSALYAFNSNRIAKRALKIASAEYNDKQSNFEVYIKDGFRWTDKESKRKFLLFNITITNKSESKNSFTASFEIKYRRKNLTKSKINFPHNHSLNKTIPHPNYPIFENDIIIDEKSKVTSWLICEEKTTNQLSRIEEYVIKVSDIKGLTQSKSLLIIRSITDEIK